MIKGVHENKPYGLEKDTVNAILDYLEQCNIPHARIRNTGAIVNRNGKYIFGKHRHNQPGISDIIACYNGYPIAIEVKSQFGKLSESQEKWLNKWIISGGTAWVIRNIGEFIINISNLKNKKIH